MGIITNAEVCLDVKIKVTHYVPYRAAPMCYNHDSLNFADPGDDEEIEYDVFVEMYKTKYDKETNKAKRVKVKEFPLPTELYEVLQSQLDEVALEKARGYEEGLKEAALEAKYDSMKDDGFI